MIIIAAMNGLVDVCGSHSEGYHVSPLTPVAQFLPDRAQNQSRLNIPGAFGRCTHSCLICLPDLLVSQEGKCV